MEDNKLIEPEEWFRLSYLTRHKLNVLFSRTEEFVKDVFGDDNTELVDMKLKELGLR